MVRSIAVLILLLWALSAVTAAEPQGGELLFYRHEGGFSNHQSVEMTIKSDGSGLVHYDRLVHREGKSEPQEFDYSFRLDAAELSALKARIYSVDFFNQPTEDTEFATDVGKTTIRVTLDGKNHELTFRYRSGMQALTNLIWQLVNQGEILKDLADQGSVYEVISAVSPNLAGRRVLQPEVFVEPLSEFMDTEKGFEKLAYAVGALEAISTPDEFIGVLFDKLEKAQGDRRAILIKAIIHANQQHIHTEPPKEAMAALLLKYLREDGLRWPKLSENEKQSYSETVRFMAYQRYEPAVPVLAALVPYAYQGLYSNLGFAFNKMPWQTVTHVVPLLQSDAADVRSTAAAMLGNLLNASLDPKAYPPSDRERFLSHMRTHIAPALDKLAKDDPDESVRSTATRALEQIGRGWAE